ncbi:MAG: hypothetical protein Kow0058_04790 [Roseovarius sp.]
MHPHQKIGAASQDAAIAGRPGEKIDRRVERGRRVIVHGRMSSVPSIRRIPFLPFPFHPGCVRLTPCLPGFDPRTPAAAGA